MLKSCFFLRILHFKQCSVICFKAVADTSRVFLWLIEKLGNFSSYILMLDAGEWWDSSSGFSTLAPRVTSDRGCNTQSQDSSVPKQNSSQASDLNYGQGRQKMIAPRQAVTKRLGLPCREVNPRRQTCSLVTVPPIREKGTWVNVYSETNTCVRGWG